MSPTLARSANWSGCWLWLASVWFAVRCSQFRRVGSSQTRQRVRDESSLVRFNGLCPWGLSPRGSCCSINWPDSVQRTSSSLRMHQSNAVPAPQWGVKTQIYRVLWDSEWLLCETWSCVASWDITGGRFRDTGELFCGRELQHALFSATHTKNNP